MFILEMFNQWDLLNCFFLLCYKEKVLKAFSEKMYCGIVSLNQISLLKTK